jgi:hypothetical protein
MQILVSPVPQFSVFGLVKNPVGRKGHWMAHKEQQNRLLEQWFGQSVLKGQNLNFSVRQILLMYCFRHGLFVACSPEPLLLVWRESLTSGDLYAGEFNTFLGVERLVLFIGSVLDYRKDVYQSPSPG